MGCRVSYLCKLRFLTRNLHEQLYIAEVLSFLRVVKTDGATKRMAVCKLFKATESGGLLKATAASQRAADTAIVEVDMVDCKLVTARDDGVLYGMTYGNTSGIG